MLRTTLSLAALIAKFRKAKHTSLNQVVNAALREDLARLVKPPALRNKFHTPLHSPGRCYIPNMDNAAEVLAIAEGEQFK